MTRQDSKSRLISIILPVFNGESFLDNCIKSVLTQTHRNLQLIIINDNSTDTSCKIIDKYVQIDQRVYLFKHEVNKGGANARNTGIGHAAGEYIAFIDQDDVWQANKLESQLRFLVEHDSDIVSCGIEYRNTITKRSLINRPKGTGFANKDKQIRSFLNANLIPSFSCVLLKRTVIDKIGLIDSSYSVADDYDYWLRAARNNNIGFLQEVAVIKYEDQHNSSWCNAERVLLESIGIKKKYFDLYGFKGKNMAISNIYFSAGLMYVIRDDVEKARGSFRNALKTHYSLRTICFYSVSILLGVLSPPVMKIVILAKMKILGTRNGWLLNITR